MRAGETGTRYIENGTLTDLTCKVGAPADWFKHEGFVRGVKRALWDVSVMAVDSVERAFTAGLFKDPVLKSGRAGGADHRSARHRRSGTRRVSETARPAG